MSFIASDIYLASGTGTIYNEWVPYVTKFDSSSFVNWEEDNLPLYDLEDRTNLLWSKLGYPIANGFSGIPGMIFAVSADAPFVGESSGIIFKSVSSIINALPEVITVPIIIEVANFGDLGELKLQNIKFKDRGGLEIINRNFVQVPYINTADGLYSQLNSTLSSTGAWDTWHETSCISISSLVLSSTFGGFSDARFNYKNIVFYNRAYGFNGLALPTSSIFGLRRSTGIEDTSYKRYQSVNYDTMDFTVSAYDHVPFNGLAGTSNPGTMRRTTHSNSTTTPLVGVLYGNWFKNIIIKNCNGPLFIRGFAVDGGDLTNDDSTTLTHTTVNGYDIENSTVLIENALACRNKQAGFRISNSNVCFSRHIVAIRNYTLDDYDTRNSYKSAGIRCLNSNIVVSASPYASGTQAIIQSTRNHYGIELFNSRWIGGQARKDYSNTSAITHIQTHYNNGAGFKADGSYLEIPGRIDSYDNDIGLEITNTQVKLNEGTFEFNNSYGVKALNSNIEYNFDLYKYTAINTTDSAGHIHFKFNGVNLLLDKSNLYYTDGTSLDSKYGTFTVSGTVGVVNDSAGQSTGLPNLQVFNGSNLRLYKPYVYNNQTGFDTTLPIYGILAAVKNNSKATFIGANDAISVFIGPPNLTQQKYTAGIYADNASIVEFQGPTLICNNGVGVLAENQSIINLTPPRDTFGNILTSAFDLSSSKNHTKVEIHATRACLVANKNSIINIQDLGSYNVFWPTANVSSADYNLTNGFGIDSVTSGGYLQFYPNGQDSQIIAASAGRSDITQFNAGIIASPSLGANDQILIETLDSPSDSSIRQISTGGMCVRAMNGSIVNVKNVHFPCGWDNTSGIHYDASGGNCDLLRIWNIGSDSELEASYFTISGLYPSLAGYYGPSAVYLSGAVVASSAPSSTPDTGVLSVLDSYGASGSTVGTNYGPFRIYVSVDGPAKFLNYFTSAGLIYNSAYQAWAQGYNPSGPVSAAPQVSSFYSNLNGSAFPYTSAMIDPGYKSRIRLDESAANSFANARNGALAKSGRVPFCTIYRSGNTEGSEGFSTSATGHGAGLLSVNIFDLSRLN